MTITFRPGAAIAAGSAALGAGLLALGAPERTMRRLESAGRSPKGIP